MAVYIITGKLGSGKTLVGVGLMRDALVEGRRVATNVDLFLEELLGWRNRTAVVYRLPDQLSAKAFEDIGCGNETVEMVRGRPVYDEGKNGLIVLDEGGLSLNSRDYREDGRKEFIKWCIHSRKKGWDVAIIVQHFDTLDKQVRDMFGELVVYCKRLDRIGIPYIGGLLKTLGFGGGLMQVHLAICKYGSTADSPVSWRKVFKGRDLWFSYDTRQQYFPSGEEAVYQLLPPYLVKGRYHDHFSARWSVVADMFRNGFCVRMARLPVFFFAMVFGVWLHAHYGGKSVIPDAVGSTVQSQAAESVLEMSAGGAVVVGDVEEAVVVSIWERSYISKYAAFDGRKVYGFRTFDGEVVDVPAGVPVIGIDRCHAVVKIDGGKYSIRCKSQS
jgi:hypothetical protein